MKRFLFNSGILLLLALILAGALKYAGTLILPADLSGTPLRVTDVSLSVPCDDRQSTRRLELTGEGFDSATRVSLVKRAADSAAVRSRLPLEGVFGAALRHGRTLYLGSNDRGLKALDLGQPLQPVLVGEYLENRTVSDIARRGTLLFLACGRQGLVVMQVARDGRLSQVSAWMTPKPVTGCVVLGHLLFAVSASQELLVYDVAQPEAPRQLDSVSVDGQIIDIAAARDYLYLITKTRKLVILQQTATGARRLYQTLPLPARPYDILLHRGILYVAAGTEVVRYRLVQPGVPEQMQRLDGFELARQLFAGAEYLYVSDGFSRLQRFAIDSLVRQPPLVLDRHIQALVEYRDMLYLAGVRAGLLMVPVPVTHGLRELNTLTVPGSAHDLAVKDRQLYIAATRGGTLKIGLNEAEPQIEQISEGRSEALALFDQRLYVARGPHGVEVVDIARPAEARVIAHWQEHSAYEIAAGEHYLALGKGVAGVELVALGADEHPRVTDRLGDIHPVNLKLRDNFLFIAGKSRQVYIYRIDREGRLQPASRLAAPFPMSHFTLPLDLALYRDMLYIANGASGLLIADISDPYTPEIIGELDLPGFSKSLALGPERLFVAGQQGGVTTLDIRNPETPEIIGHQRIAEISRGLAVAGGSICVARFELGVAILPVPQNLEDVTLHSDKRLSVRLPRLRKAGGYDLWVRTRTGTEVVEEAVRCQPVRN